MNRTLESLSLSQARKLVLLSQGVPPKKQTRNSLDATLAAIEHLGYIQIDTISAIQRAHHHTLWTRNPDYQLSHLDDLLDQKKVFEYWSHAAAYLPMKDYRFSLFRKQAIASGKENHWYHRDEKLMSYVLDRIRDEGPLMAKDFETKGKTGGEWRTHPVKQALENLFMHGELMIPYRANFHKVYELTERVVPDQVNRSLPEKGDYVRFLIKRYLHANGLGNASEISYLLKNTKDLVRSTMQEMTWNGELQEICVTGNTYYVLPSALNQLNKPLSRSKLKIISPFDNLIIQRKRTLDIFGFDYVLECYVPAPKRKYGYFVLPVLWDGKLVARMDCKADRKRSHMHMFHLALEPGLKKKEAFALALGKELLSFLRFNACTSISIHKTSPSDFKEILQDFIQ
jgi:uncharacterized protein YcaQ